MRSRSRWYSERVGDGVSGLSLPALVSARAAYGDSALSRSARRETIASATSAERVGLMAARTAIEPVSLPVQSKYPGIRLTLYHSVRRLAGCKFCLIMPKT